MGSMLRQPPVAQLYRVTCTRFQQDGERLIKLPSSRGHIDDMVALAMALVTAAKFGEEEEWVPMLEVV
jgi:hypothetical protein